MAGGEYAHCDRCGAKVFYDAEVDYDVPSFGAMWVLCAACRTEVGDEVIGVIGAILDGQVALNIEQGDSNA